MESTKRTTIRLSDERQRLPEEGSKIVANGPDDDPPMSDVIDVALTHLIEALLLDDEATVFETVSLIFVVTCPLHSGHRFAVEAV